MELELQTFLKFKNAVTRTAKSVILNHFTQTTNVLYANWHVLMDKGYNLLVTGKLHKEYITEFLSWGGFYLAESIVESYKRLLKKGSKALIEKNYLIITYLFVLVFHFCVQYITMKKHILIKFPRSVHVTSQVSNPVYYN